MAITVEGLTRSFGELTAVSDLSFGVAPGEIVGLLGPNGAGKTTTLRTLAGILRPSAGRAVVAGFDVVQAPLEAKRRLAFMPDEPHLFDYLTVAEHLQLVARLYGIHDIEARSGPLLEELEMTGWAHKLPGELSRGMRQKVVIACGLVRTPQVLLFDEPLTGLDPIGIRRMRETIVRRGQAGAAILVSSHLLHLVEEVCTRIIIMNRGRKVADGSVAQLAARANAGEQGTTLEQIFVSMTSAGETSPE